MSRHHHRVSASAASPRPTTSANDRTLATGNQMRDALGIATAPLAVRSEDLTSKILQRHHQTLQNLATEDLRHDDQNISYPHYRRADGSQARVVGRQICSPAMQRAGMPDQLRFEFETPERVLVCMRRTTRRRVLFALRRAGKGSKRPARARWSEHSYISCKQKKGR